MKKILIPIFIAILLAVPAITNAALAGNILDPLCLFSWRDECKDNVTYNTNINSNVNSPGGIIIGNTSVIDTNPYSNGSTHVYSSGYYEYDGGYYGGGSEYHNDDDYDNGNNNSSLNVSCYADDRYVEEGDDVRWTASVSGGNGSYSYDWSGSEGLDGNSRTVTIEYDNEGTKSASVRVSSGNRTVTESCGNVYVENDNDNDDDDDYDNDSFSISCDANSSTAYVGERVTWEVNVRGASIRDIEWSGSEGLDGDDEDVTISYDYAGYKSASVEVRTNEGTKSRSCGSVNVYEKNYSYNTVPVYTNINSNTGPLSVICAVYPLKTTVNKPVTWIATASGGKGGYTYSWSGTDGVKGGQVSFSTAYSTPGVKSTVLTVRSNSGEVITKACESTVTVSAASTIKKPTAVKVDINDDKNENHSAASIFSLGNVPWGAVALITIFVLFSTIMYLVIGKKD